MVKVKCTKKKVKRAQPNADPYDPSTAHCHTPLLRPPSPTSTRRGRGHNDPARRMPRVQSTRDERRMLSSLLVTCASVPRVSIAPGVEMPLLNFGFQKDHAAAIKLGVRGLDTALTYGDAQQQEVGKAVRESGVARSELFVTSKIPCCPSPFTSRLCATTSPNATANVLHDLEMLGLSYVDLMLVHWPCGSFAESVATYKAIEPLVMSGQARAIGISNFNASAIEALLPLIHVKPAVNQCGFSISGHDESTSLWGRDDDTQRACVKHGITYSAYSPLGGVAKHGTGHVLKDPTVNAVAKAHNRSAAQVALRWVTQKGVVAVTSSNEIAHVESDLQTFDFTLTSSEMSELAKVQ